MTESWGTEKIEDRDCSFMSFIIITISVILVLYSMFGFVVGISAGNYGNHCTFKTIATKYNPGYQLGCFITKERF